MLLKAYHTYTCGIASPETYIFQFETLLLLINRIVFSGHNFNNSQIQIYSNMCSKMLNEMTAEFVHVLEKEIVSLASRIFQCVEITKK